MAKRYCVPGDRDNELAILEEMKRRNLITDFHQNSKDALYDAEVWIKELRLLLECRTRDSGGGKPITAASYPDVRFGYDKYKEACRLGVEGYRFVVQYPDRCLSVPIVPGLSHYLGTQHDREPKESQYCVDLPLGNAIELWQGTVCIHRGTHLKKAQSA